MKIPVLDKLFLKGFIGPCLLAFFIVEFVLIMQRLWKDIDSILGKGYSFFDFVDLIYYFALASIPMALPLTILLSSVMVFGDMAEKYELSSVKSAGISFLRILRPGLMVAFSVFLFSILSSNFIKPEAFKGFYKKIREMKTNKLTFAFDEKIFNKEFKNFSIRIGKKEDDGESFEDVMIYDHTDQDPSVVNLIRAQYGSMRCSPDQKHLIMDLYDGNQVKELRQDAATTQKARYGAFGRPVIRYTFSSLKKVFDLTEMLDLNVVNVSFKEYEMLNSFELIHVIDSLNRSEQLTRDDNFIEFSLFDPPIPAPAIAPKKAKPTKSKLSANPSTEVGHKTKFNSRSVNTTSKTRRSVAIPDVSLPIVMTDAITTETSSILDVIDYKDKPKILDNIKKRLVSYSSSNINNKNEYRVISATRSRYIFALHQIYSFATVCILFLFIGGPAGAIVKKGGFGYPLLIAIGFYITFVMSSIIGKKLSDSGALHPIIGAWVPCLILLPFAAYLTWRALHDNRPLFRKAFAKVKKLRKGS